MGFHTHIQCLGALHPYVGFCPEQTKECDRQATLRRQIPKRSRPRDRDQKASACHCLFFEKMGRCRGVKAKAFILQAGRPANTLETQAGRGVP